MRVKGEEWRIKVEVFVEERFDFGSMQIVGRKIGFSEILDGN